MLATLTSTRHPIVKMVRELHQPRGRREHGLFAVEGENGVTSALDARWPLDTLLATPETLSQGWAERATQAGVKVQPVSATLLETMSDAQPGASIIALAKLPTAPPIANQWPGLTVVLDGIGDPGNIGTLLRTANAAGANGLVLSEGSADPFGPKAVRASAGNLFFLAPVALPDRTPAAIMQTLKAAGVPIAVAVAHEGQNCFTAPWPQKCALVLGHETRGVAPEFEQAASLRVTIPMYGNAESLNVAAAGAILCYAWRQQWPEAT